MNIDFIFKGRIHNIQVSATTNQKLTEFNVVMQSFHFTFEQVEKLDLTLDSNTCFDCDFSFNKNNGKSGGCYTHKGQFRWGLDSKLKRLNKLLVNDKLQPYSEEIEKKILKVASNISFLRLGAYGEATMLPQSLLEQLPKKVKSYTAYTQMWRKEEFKWAAPIFMASTRNVFEANIAKDRNFRFYNAGEKISNAVLCPASSSLPKEKRTTCEQCRLCGGANKIAKSIFNPLH